MIVGKLGLTPTAAHFSTVRLNAILPSASWNDGARKAVSPKVHPSLSSLSELHVQRIVTFFVSLLYQHQVNGTSHEVSDYAGTSLNAY
jgi:hypothetical protein